MRERENTGLIVSAVVNSPKNNVLPPGWVQNKIHLFGFTSPRRTVCWNGFLDPPYLASVYGI
jgi:hypothetical protein